MKKFLRKVLDVLKIGGLKKDAILLVISAACVILSLCGISIGAFDLAWVAVILCGLPIILEAIILLITELDITADVLVSIAMIASICIGEVFAAGEVAVIMQLGSFLEELTVSRTNSQIEKMADLTSKTARLISADGERIIPVEKVAAGDILKILPGETIPVDGVITSGTTSINQAVLTGESLPADKEEGDEVKSGCVNLYGAFEMKATRVGEDSSIEQIIKMVQSADASKTKVVRTADKWAKWLVLISISTALITWLITRQIIRAVTILVVFCPCALVLATPTAVTAAIGNCTRHGFLVKDGSALEKLSGVKNIAFDKTGTLTYGTLKVMRVKSASLKYSEKDLYAYAAAAEAFSEHPIGKAIVNSYKKTYGPGVPEALNVEAIPGRGLKAEVCEKEILAGNLKFMEEKGIAVRQDPEAASCLGAGATLSYIAIDKEYAGFIALTDSLRPESRTMIDNLKAQGITPILLTGDNERAAAQISKQLGIEKVQSSCLPEDKLHYIESMENQTEKMCMVGDGINDAPALKRASVSIAMAGSGSDIAAESADIALMDDNVKEIPHITALSRHMMNTIRLNIAFSMTINAAAVVLAIIGILGPVLGALIHNAGSVLVIINSAFLLKWKKKDKSTKPDASQIQKSAKPEAEN